MTDCGDAAPKLRMAAMFDDGNAVGVRMTCRRTGREVSALLPVLDAWTLLADLSRVLIEPDCDEITPLALAEFEKIFRDWQASWPTCDLLQVGATPVDQELKALAKATLVWAKKVLL